MARAAGRNGQFAIAATAGASETPVAYGSIKSWSLDMKTDKLEATCMGDASKQYVASLPDGQGQFTGIWDSSDVELLLTAALSGDAYECKIVPNTGEATKYFTFMATLDLSVSAEVNGLVEVSGSWAATNDITPHGF